MVKAKVALVILRRGVHTHAICTQQVRCRLECFQESAIHRAHGMNAIFRRTSSTGAQCSLVAGIITNVITKVIHKQSATPYHVYINILCCPCENYKAVFAVHRRRLKAFVIVLLTIFSSIDLI